MKINNNKNLAWRWNFRTFILRIRKLKLFSQPEELVLFQLNKQIKNIKMV